MVLTKHFKETIYNRAQKDEKFRKALLQEAMNEFLSGDFNVAKILLKEYINSSVTFQRLSQETQKNDKSLQRMLSPQGNPTTENFFSMLHAIQKIENITLSARIK
jgi:DNA-binding phage protein